MCGGRRGNLYFVSYSKNRKPKTTSSVPAF